MYNLLLGARMSSFLNKHSPALHYNLSLQKQNNKTAIFF
ncbi:hypothetical protein FPSM_01009 [Flavobacterium psychrophilum]|nr:hypothetical protein FPSM_01009 [Flavobacterium psychrophilum]